MSFSDLARTTREGSSVASRPYVKRIASFALLVAVAPLLSRYDINEMSIELKEKTKAREKVGARVATTNVSSRVNEWPT